MIYLRRIDLKFVEATELVSIPERLSLFASPDAIPNDQINDGEGQSDTDDDNDDNDENSQVAEIEDGK